MGKSKIGLTLAGGGAKGAYQVGVYKALQESKIKISGVTGTSIGSFNAAMIASDEIDKLEYFWLNDDIGKLMGFYNDMNINKKNYYDHIKEFSIPYVSIVLNKGLPISGLKNKITKIINEDKLRKSDFDFGLVTYRVSDNKPLYLFKEDIPNGKLVDYIVASCYLPVFHSEKLDEDSYYLDGGFFDNEPYNMLGEKGYDKIYVVELGSVGVKPKNYTNANIVRIKPSRNLGGMLNTNKYKIKENIELGYYDGLKIFKNLDGIKFIFKRFPNWFYKMLLRKVDSRTLTRAQVFFMTKNNKILVIKALEYVLKYEKKTYLNVYNPYKEIKRIQKNYKNDKKIIAYKLLFGLKLL